CFRGSHEAEPARRGRARKALGRARVEWACIEALNPHLDWPREQSVGTHIDVSHAAATPPGLKVTVKARLVEVHGRRLVARSRPMTASTWSAGEPTSAA